MYLEEERGARWMICDNRLEASFKFAKPGRGGGKEKRGKVDDIAVSLSTNSEKGDGNAIKGKGPLRGMFPPVQCWDKFQWDGQTKVFRGCLESGLLTNVFL